MSNPTLMEIYPPPPPMHDGPCCEACLDGHNRAVFMDDYCCHLGIAMEYEDE